MFKLMIARNTMPFFLVYLIMLCFFLALLENNLFNHFLFPHIMLLHLFSNFVSDTDTNRKNHILSASKARRKRHPSKNIQNHENIGILAKKTSDSDSKAVPVINDPCRSLLLTYIGIGNALLSKSHKTRHKYLR